MISVSAFLVVAVVLFAIGMLGVMICRNIIVMFMSIELMLNAGNLALISFSTFLNNLEGHVIVFLVLTVAAAEAAVGLAMVITVYRNRESINVDRFNLLRR